MQILIEIGENLEDTLEEVKKKISEGWTVHNKKYPKFRLVNPEESLPMDDESASEYTKQKQLENMHKILSKGFDPFA